MGDENPKRFRILIADDEVSVRAVLRELLENDYDCEEGSSAEEALEKLRANKFDIVLSDITMGGMSGLEMIPHVLEIAPDSTIIMISGEQNIESAILAMRAGAFDYITKPFDLLHVEAAIRRAVKNFELRESRRNYQGYLENLIGQRTAQVDHLSFFDVLTDLPNRTLFEDRLKQSVDSTERLSGTLAVALLDLDRFKIINDTLGHAVGDELLRDVGGRLRGCVREGETVARVGSDEFAMLLLSGDRQTDIVRRIFDVHEALKKPFHCGDHEFFLTVSTGVGRYPADGTDASELLKHAGAALNYVKQDGGNNFRLYSADMNDRANRRLNLESSLRRALEHEEFVVHYQAQVETASLDIVGMEALVRWQHREMGLVSPMEFIPLLEETGLIVELGAWVLKTACAQAKIWQGHSQRGLTVAVNLSSKQFREPALAEMVHKVLVETGLDAGHLELELTESSVMSDPASAIATLRKLKATGIGIAIDDFGTGYSSLSYLKDLPITTLKIDRSFLKDCASGAAEAAIVKAIIGLARSLELQVKAEGVETVEQLQFLSRLGCDQMQGYLLSRPLASADFEALLSVGISGFPDITADV